MLMKRIINVTKETAAQFAFALIKKLSIETIRSAGREKQIKNISFSILAGGKDKSFFQKRDIIKFRNKLMQLN